MSLDARVDEGSLAEVAAMLGVPDAAALAEIRFGDLQRRTHKQLLDISKRLGLTGTSRLSKDALAAKLSSALSELAGARRPPRAEPRRDGKPKQDARPEARPDSRPEPAPEPAPEADDPVLTHKFEVGEHGASREEPRTIPWSYGHDRVTGMPVDP